MVGPCASEVEAAVRPAPYTALPVFADSEVLSGAGVELEPRSVGACSGLCENCGINGLSAFVRDE